MLTAPAGSAVATQLLNGVATQLQAQLTQQVAVAGGDPTAAPQVEVTPVVELSDADPTGSGLTAAAFPLMLGGMLGGILVSLTIAGVWRRLTAVTVFAAATSIVLTLVMQTWFEYLQGDFWLNVLAIGMSILATGMFIVGCVTLLGNPGVGVGAAVTMLVGNPLSAAAMPWQFIVEPWGAIGQFTVPRRLQRAAAFAELLPRGRQHPAVVDARGLGRARHRARPHRRRNPRPPHGHAGHPRARRGWHQRGLGVGRNHRIRRAPGLGRRLSTGNDSASPHERRGRIVFGVRRAWRGGAGASTRRRSSQCRSQGPQAAARRRAAAGPR